MGQTFFLIDAYTHLFRAYFAIRSGMRSSVTDEPTNAIFGFCGMLFRLLAQNPDALYLVAFDAPGRTFRDDLCDTYKATRTAIPEDLLQQVPRVVQILDAIGIHHLSIPGLEADDIIAAATHAVTSDTRPSASEIALRILSNDKDLEQLISDRTAIYDASKETLFDTAALFEKKGIRPEQVTDYQTLTGDAVDNIPGIPNIGPKTAAKYLQLYGSLDGIYNNLEALSASHRNAFESARVQTVISKQLVTLKCDAMPDFQWEQARRRSVNTDAAIALFEELGMHRYQDAVRKLSLPTANR